MADENPFDIEAGASAPADVQESIDTVFSDNIEEEVLSVIPADTSSELLKIARQHNLSENDPAWLFVHTIVASSQLSSTAANAARVAASEAQAAVMEKFDTDRKTITDKLIKSIDQAHSKFEHDFDDAQKKVIRNLQDIVNDFEDRKVGWKKSTVSAIAAAVFIAAGLGYWLGSVSLYRIINDQEIENMRQDAQNFQVVWKNYQSNPDKKFKKRIRKEIFAVD